MRPHYPIDARFTQPARSSEQRAIERPQASTSINSPARSSNESSGSTGPCATARRTARLRAPGSAVRVLGVGDQEAPLGERAGDDHRERVEGQADEHAVRVEPRWAVSSVA